MRIHFIAIGGSIMHNLAIALAKKGHIVSGSDDFIYEPSKSSLAKNKLLPENLGWFPEKIDENIDAIILGMHSDENNPELLKAKELDLNIYSYPEFIYEESIDKIRVVIGGSFGKTTITSMIMHVLKTLGRDFDYMVGAKFEGFESTVELSKEAPLIIIEGDEYFASVEDKRPKFLVYRANIGLISGISWDYKHAFPTFEDYLAQFERFIESIEEKGTLIYNKEDKNVQTLVSANNSNINKYGYRLPEYSINKGITSINSPKGEIPLQVFGKYNLSNIAAASAVCQWLGLSQDSFYEAIQSFKGAERRLEYVTSNQESVVYQDFAQYPSKIKASIQALKEQYPTKKLVSIIEIQMSIPIDGAFFKEYKEAFDQSDYLVIFRNQDALKHNALNAKISEATLQEGFRNNQLKYLSNTQELEDFVRKIDSHGKNLLFMSSGNFGGINIVNFGELFIS